jgi:hypothetical protein
MCSLVACTKLMLGTIITYMPHSMFAFHYKVVTAGWDMFLPTTSQAAQTENWS